MAKIPFGLFIFLLIFSPLAFGTVEPWSYTVMETLTILACLVFLINTGKEKEGVFYEVPGLAPLLLLVFYGLLQLVPLPQEIVKNLSPSTYRLYTETVLAVEPSGWVSLSIDRKATLMEVFRLTSYVIFYVLTVQLLTKKERLKRTVAAVAVFVSLLSVFSILQHFLSNNKIYWVRELTGGGSMFGPYVNRNHYAGLIDMLFPLVLGLFLFHKPRVPRITLRENISALFSREETNVYLLLGFSSILSATSVFLTLSRSGIVSLCLSMTFFGILFLLRGSDKKRAVIIIVVGVLIALSVGWFGWGPIFERFGQLKNAQGDISELRFEIWKDSSHIVQDFPLTGTGFGTFVNIYPKYRTIPGDGIADHAHNDYIELLSDGGITAGFFILWFILIFVFRTFSSFRRRRETYSVYIFIASVTGILSLVMHSLTDFNLHTGANGLYLFFLFGLAVSAANTRMREGLDNTYLPKKKLPFKAASASFGILLVAMFIVNAGVLAGGAFFSKIKDTALRGQLSKQELDEMKNIAFRAALCDPLEARYWYAMANIEWLLSDRVSALQHYTKAVDLNPTSGEYLQRLGLVQSEFGRRETAEELLRAGVEYQVRDASNYRRYAVWLLSVGKKDEALQIIRKAISLEPDKTREYITLMILNNLTDAEILSSLPDRVVPHQIFADYLSKTGADRMAEEEYLNSLRYLGNESSVKPSYFNQVIQYYMRKDRHEEALEIVKKAMEVLPDDAEIRTRAGEIYEKLGQNEKAEAEYRKALSINPANQYVRRRLDKLLEGKK